MTTDVPAPLEWHPWYRDKTWLIDWLENRGQYASHYHLQLPVPRRLAMFDPDPKPSDATRNTITLTRQRCAGPAPYVGRPFVYVWNVGIDNLGRMIAGDATPMADLTWMPRDQTYVHDDYHPPIYIDWP